MRRSQDETFEHQFIAALLAGRQRELADAAARELMDRFPDISARYRPLPVMKWSENLGGRLADLAAAMEVCSPALFASQIAWARTGFEARGVPVDDLQRSLVCLAAAIRREIPEEELAVLDEYFGAATAALSNPGAPEESSVDGMTPAKRIAAKYILAILQGDRLEASQVVIDAARNGMPVRRIYRDVLCPAQEELGRMWHLNEINVAEEHFASVTTGMVMSQLQPFAQRKPRDGRCLLAACVEGDLHDLGLRMLADTFEMEGWRVICLGASVPARDLATAAAFFEPDLVALSVSMPFHLEELRLAMRLIREEAKVKVMLGGRVFAGDPEMWKEFGADAFASNPEEAVGVADAILPRRAASGPMMGP